MKALILVAALALTSVAPVQAASTAQGLFDNALPHAQVDRRKPRIPGGSGCDTPRDIRQHPECRPQ